MKRSQTPNSKLQTVGPRLGDEELRQWLENYIKEHPHLTTWVLGQQDHTGVSRTALDDYLAGTYFLAKESGGKGVSPNRSDIEKRIRAYREKVDGVIAGGAAVGFLESIAYRRLCTLWDLLVERKVIGIAHSGPGDGKTFPLQQLLAHRNTSRPISILCSRNVTTGYFVQRLAEEASLSVHYSIPRLEDMIADKLKKNPRGIVVDQANYLNERGLGTICHIWERARVPIMLVGTEELFKLFMTSNMTQDVRAQLTSRVALNCPLSRLTIKEAKTFLQRTLGKLATDENVAKIMEVTGGGFRSLTFIVPEIDRLKRVNEEKLHAGKITMDDIIVAAGSRLMAA